MERTDFLHAGANSGKLKVISMILGWAWSRDPKTCGMIRMNWADFLHIDSDVIFFG